MKKISKRDLRRLAEGDIPFILQGQPFIVMRQSVTLRRTEEQSAQWNLDLSPEEEDSYPISRETALSIIEANDMSLVHQEKSGQIYELPGQPFWEMYHRPSKKAIAS